MKIDVHRYPVPTDAERAAWPDGVTAVSDHWQGWIEPEDRQGWILFVAADGTVQMFDRRDPDTGAVLDPASTTGLSCGSVPVDRHPAKQRTLLSLPEQVDRFVPDYP